MTIFYFTSQELYIHIERKLKFTSRQVRTLCCRSEPTTQPGISVSFSCTSKSMFSVRSHFVNRQENEETDNTRAAASMRQTKALASVICFVFRDLRLCLNVVI